MNGTDITTSDGRVIRRSKNLRGMRDYARTSPVIGVVTKRDDANKVRGLLRVTYADGCTSAASFASYEIMIDWVRNRRTWRAAGLTHLNEDIGYLTKPGIIAGGMP